MPYEVYCRCFGDRWSQFGSEEFDDRESAVNRAVALHWQHKRKPFRVVDEAGAICFQIPKNPPAPVPVKAVKKNGCRGCGRRA
jgi:hypothetical protein